MAGEGSKLLISIPPEMKIVAAKIVRCFYGPECFVVFSYIQNERQVRDDALRPLLKLEMRDLRRIVNAMKADFVINERNSVEELPDSRPRRVSHYSVNYKALLNVTRYKLSHIRDRLDSKDRTDARPNNYTCTQCLRAFTDLDVGNLFDPMTQLLKCWFCGSVVEEKAADVAEETTRNSLAKFNEQMAGMYSMLKKFENVQFSREMLEFGPLTDGQAEDEAALSKAGKRLRQNAGVTISIGYGGEEEKPSEEKLAVPWMQDMRPSVDSPNTEAPYASLPSTLAGSKPEIFVPPAGQVSNTAPSSSGAKRPKTEDDEEFQTNGPNESEIERLLRQSDGRQGGEDSVATPKGGSSHADENEDDEYVFVAGERYHIDDVDEDLVAKMAPDELEAYTRKSQHMYL